ncbi:Histone H1 [Pleurotus pulmonarius]
MQAGNADVPPQSHPPEAVSENDLKRRYLALLPPQQIIDICLNFELHVPQYVKHSIWPIDLKAAIAALQPKPPSEPVQASNEPPMASLVRTAPAPEKDSSEQQREPPKPPDPPQTTSEPPKTDAQSGSSSQQANGSSSAPAQPAQHPAYPQPYGYPPSAYPHSPYYPPPPNYPYLPHPGYYPPPGYAPTYPSHPHPPSHPSLPHPQQPTPAPSYVPGQIEGHIVTPDDLPSYEEMIVEALMDSNDPEGWMPKQLFAWMASHYPIQSNFRPSASQALQKAFKRGRLEKSGDGKYRLNATWEGGNTSRRTTRRPQTQNNISAVPATQPLSSPFTHAPRVHHHQSSNSPAPFTPVPYQPQPAHPPQSQPQPQPQSTSSSSSTTTVPSNDEIGEGSQAWEAAQTILKALNFNSLLSMNAEEGSANARMATMTHPTEDNSHAESASRLDNPIQDANAPVIAGRASLQAQLALLATQLAEIAQISVDDPLPPEPTFSATEAIEPVPPSQRMVDVELADDSDDDDMDEVTIL